MFEFSGHDFKRSYVTYLWTDLRISFSFGAAMEAVIFPGKSFGKFTKYVPENDSGRISEIRLLTFRRGFVSMRNI